MRPRRGFTLIELLVVIGIIGILSGLLMTAIRAAHIRTGQAAARAQMGSLKTALSMYHGDYRRHPRLSPNTNQPADLMRDDAPALWAALMNQPTTELGGGKDAPYIDWTHGIGIVKDRTRLEADTMGKDGDTGVVPLEGEQLTDRHYKPFQQQHGPKSAEPLVFLDPWGNPYHYREWASVGSAAKNALHSNPPQRSGFSAPDIGGVDAPLPGPISDKPRDPYGYDIWSNGPNGVNEYGAPGSDDVSIHVLD